MWKNAVQLDRPHDNVTQRRRIACRITKATDYSRSKIREVAVKKHNCICRYNNLPATCFGRDMPSSGWDTTLYPNLKMAYHGRNM